MLLTDKGEVFVWGSNKEGQLGIGNEENLYPIRIPLDNKISSISCGYYHSFAVTDDGHLISWGDSEHGKLGFKCEGKFNVKSPKTIVLQEKVVMSVAGSRHSLLLTDSGNILSCGFGSNGELGQGASILERHSFELVNDENLKFVYICAGDMHSAAISDDGMVYTWGCGRHGKLCLGEQNFSSQYKPVLVNRLRHLTAMQISCGGCHTMVLGYRRSELGRRSSKGSILIREAKGFAEKMATQLGEIKTKQTLVKEFILPNEELKKAEENSNYDSLEKCLPLQDNYIGINKERREKLEENEESSKLMEESKKKANRFARFWNFLIKTKSQTSYHSIEEPKILKECTKLEDIENESDKCPIKENLTMHAEEMEKDIDTNEKGVPIWKGREIPDILPQLHKNVEVVESQVSSNVVKSSTCSLF